MPLVPRTFDQLINFTRTSAGTYVDETGKIASTPASRNLLTFTQEFDNAAWTKSAATVTANTTTAPDGTNTADTLTAAAGTVSPLLSFNTVITAIPAVASFYVKAGTYGIVQISNEYGGGFYANFDLTNGVVGSKGAGCTASSITAVGGGWYRCSAAFTSFDNCNLGFIGSTTATRQQAFTAAGTETVFVWGAQLELGSTATEYTRNYGGLFPPRFDYDPVTLAPKGLLIEEQRTNLLTYSAQFDNAAWAKNNAALTSGIADPAGGTSAFTVTASGGAMILQQAPTVTSGVALSASIWIKRRTGTGAISMRCGDATAIPITVTPSWTRVAVTATPTSTGGRMAVIIATDGDAVDIYGAQLEAGAFATSYIPTVASQVTRTADVATISAPNFAPWYNQSEGTFVVEFDVLGFVANQRVFEAGDGTGANFIGWYSASGSHRLRVTNAGATTSAIGLNSPPAAGVIYKEALAFQTGNCAISVDAATVATLGSTIPTGLNKLNIGSATPTDGNQLNGHIRSIRYYPTRLSNAQLQALTA